MRLINLTVPKETENPLTFLARKMVMRDSYVLIHKSILENLISMGFQKTSTDMFNIIPNTEECYYNDKIGEFRIEGSFGCEYSFLNAVKPKTSKTYTVCNNSCEFPDIIIFISSTRITVEDIYLEPGTDLIEELTEIKKEHKEGLMVMIQQPNRFDMKYDSTILPRYHSQRKQTVLCKISDKRKKVIVYSNYSNIGSWLTISAVEKDYKRIDIFNQSSKETLKCIKFIHVNKS